MNLWQVLSVLTTRRRRSLIKSLEVLMAIIYNKPDSDIQMLSGFGKGEKNV